VVIAMDTKDVEQREKIIDVEFERRIAAHEAEFAAGRSPSDQWRDDLASFDRQNDAADFFLATQRAARAQQEAPLVHKTFHAQPQPAQQHAVVWDEKTLADWNRWADGRITKALDDIVAAQLDDLQDQIEELRTELAALRASVTINEAARRAERGDSTCKS
jgi:hypothetical protein